MNRFIYPFSRLISGRAPLVLVVMLAGGFRAVAGEESTLAGRAATSVVIKDIAAEPILFIETTGPYWRIGSVLTQAFEYKRANNLPGPVYVRYLQDPVRTGPQALQVQVGIVTDGRHEDQAPFRSGMRDAETVATRVIDSTSPEPRLEATMMSKWASQNEYVPVGPLTEVYLTDLSSETTRVEIQMPVRKYVPPPMPAQLPIAEVREVPAEGAKDPAVSDFDRQAVAVVPSVQSPTVVQEAHPVPTALNEPDAPSVAGAIEPAAHRSAEQLSQGQTTAPSVVSIPERKSGAAQVVAPPVAELLRQGEYNLIAELLIRTRPQYDSTFQLWIMQLVSRLGAAARGVEKTTVDSRGHLAGLHRALSTRCDAAFGPSKPDPRDGGMMWARMQDDGKLAAKRAVIRECDVMMVRLASRSLDAQTLESTLAGILERAAVEVLVDLGEAP